MKMPLSRQYVVRALFLLLMFGAVAVAVVFVESELRVYFNESHIDGLCQDARQYMMLNRNDSAIASLARAERLLTEDTDPLVRGKVYARIGYFYKSQADYERAMAYGRQALDANRKGGDRKREAWDLLCLGDYIRFRDSRDTASLDYYRAAWRMHLPDDTLAGNIIQRIGLYYHYRQDTDSALYYLRASLAYPQKKYEHSIRLLFMGITFHEAHQLDSAEYYVRQALAHTTSLRQRSGCTTLLHRIAIEQGDTAAMLLYGNRLLQYKDSIMMLENRTAQGLTKMEVERTARERQAKRRFAWWMGGFCVMLIGVAGGLTWLFFRKQKNKDLAVQELEQAFMEEKAKNARSCSLETSISEQFKSRQGLRLEENRRLWVQRLREATAALPAGSPYSPRRKAALQAAYARLLHADDWEACCRLVNDEFNHFVDKINRYYDRMTDKSRSTLLCCCLLLLEVPQADIESILGYTGLDTYRSTIKGLCRRFGLTRREELFPFLLYLMLND